MPIVTCPNCGAKNRVEFRENLEPICGRCKTKLSAPAATDGRPFVVSDATFSRDVVNAKGPVLVDAWAPWCGPCRLISPIVDQLAAESDGRYTVAKLNVDESPRTAAAFRIESIPTLLIFKNGKPVDRIVGAQPKKAILERLNKAV